MFEPELPHLIPNSPISILVSDDEQLLEIACDVPESMPKDPSVCFMDRTRPSALHSDLLDNVEHANANSWTSIVVGALTPKQRANLLSRQKLQYGDDCSGARAAYEALRQRAASLRHNGIASVTIEDMFASEWPGTKGKKRHMRIGETKTVLC